MIFKIFGNKGAGSATASVNYLVGKRHDRAGAAVLKGNIEVTRQLAESLDFKNRYTVGVLSFEEKDLPEQAKDAIMQSFESTVFAGLDDTQYSIAWVEHKDKDRLELNFFIANVELTTGKRLQPYYDRADRGLIKAWKDIINHDYGLSDPNDPQKTLDLKPNENLPRTKNGLRQVIHDAIKQEVLAGHLTNRDEVIAHMEQMGLEIARTTKTAVSIKDPDGGRNIRFKGEYYEQNFRIDESYTADQDRASDSYRAGERERIQRTRAELESRTQAKREYNQARYPRPTQADFEHHQLPAQANNFILDSERYSDSNADLQHSADEQSDRFTIPNNRVRTQESRTTRADCSATEQEQTKQGQEVNEPIFDALQRAYGQVRTAVKRTYRDERQTEQADRAVTGSQSRLASTERAVSGYDSHEPNQRASIGAILDETKQREQATSERERQTTELVTEQQKALKRSNDRGFGW